LIVHQNQSPRSWSKEQGPNSLNIVERRRRRGKGKTILEERLRPELPKETKEILGPGEESKAQDQEV